MLYCQKVSDPSEGESNAAAAAAAPTDLNPSGFLPKSVAQQEYIKLQIHF